MQLKAVLLAFSGEDAAAVRFRAVHCNWYLADTAAAIQVSVGVCRCSCSDNVFPITGSAWSCRAIDAGQGGFHCVLVCIGFIVLGYICRKCWALSMPICIIAHQCPCVKLYLPRPAMRAFMVRVEPAVLRAFGGEKKAAVPFGAVL